MDYSFSIEKGSYDIPIGTFDENENIVYNEVEHYDIDVFDVTMQSDIENEEDIKILASELYPEVVSVLGDNKYIGVRVELERTLKTVLAQGDTLNNFQRSLLRQYSAMQLDINVFGLGRENDTAAKKEMV